MRVRILKPTLIGRRCRAVGDVVDVSVGDAVDLVESGSGRSFITSAYIAARSVAAMIGSLIRKLPAAGAECRIRGFDEFGSMGQGEEIEPGLRLFVVPDPRRPLG